MAGSHSIATKSDSIAPSDAIGKTKKSIAIPWLEAIASQLDPDSIAPSDAIGKKRNSDTIAGSHSIANQKLKL
jgi:hypothetical protein